MLFYILDPLMNLRYQTMKRQPKAVHALLHDNNTLAKLHHHSQKLQQLSDTVRDCLPASCASHLQACSFDGSQLTLYAYGPAQATSLRLSSSNLLQTLRQKHQLAQLSNIRIQVTMQGPQRQIPPTQTSPLAENTAKLVGELAETTIDPAVRDILRRISTRHKTKNTT